MLDSHQVCKGNKAKRNSRATDYILAHAPTTLSQGYPQVHEQHPHPLPHVRNASGSPIGRPPSSKGVFVLAMEKAGLVPVEGWRESHLSLVAVSWYTPPPIVDAVCNGLDIGAVGRRCSALAYNQVSDRSPAVRSLWWYPCDRSFKIILQY